MDFQGLSLRPRHETLGYVKASAVTHCTIMNSFTIMMHKAVSAELTYGGMYMVVSRNQTTARNKPHRREQSYRMRRNG